MIVLLMVVFWTSHCFDSEQCAKSHIRLRNLKFACESVTALWLYILSSHWGMQIIESNNTYSELRTIIGHWVILVFRTDKFVVKVLPLIEKRVASFNLSVVKLLSTIASLPNTNHQPFRSITVKQRSLFCVCSVSRSLWLL